MSRCRYTYGQSRSQQGIECFRYRGHWRATLSFCDEVIHIVDAKTRDGARRALTEKKRLTTPDRVVNSRHR